MRLRNINLAIAIAVSLALHLLLWPAGRHVLVPGWGEFPGAGTSKGPIQITLQLDSKAELAEKKKVPPPHAPLNLPEGDAPDDMGEATGKGTGAQAAKGDKPLKAREADQDQAFLSRDPVGQGRVGDLPTEYTGPRGQDGTGGQRGGSHQSADHPAPPSLLENTHAAPPAAAPMKLPMAEVPRLPRPSVVKVPLPDAAPAVRPEPVAPPPAPIASIGAAKVDLARPPVEQKKPSGLLPDLAKAPDGLITHGEATAKPDLTIVAASSTAPPMAAASVSNPAIVLAAPNPLPLAAVVAPPAPDVPAAARTADAPAPKVAAPAPPEQHAAPAQSTLAHTGDGRAPGRDRASADPAQESESESDPFSRIVTAEAFHDGRLEVRSGRKIKTTRPHFLPGAEAAFYSNPNATVVLKIAIDATGQVRSAEVIRSAGSIEIDQPCRVAVYDWWFEPSHDKHGRPIRDVVVFAIHFR